MAILGYFRLEDAEDGAVKLMYEDLDIEMFGGDDLEVTYRFPKESVERIKELLEADHHGTLYEMIREEFGPCLEKKNFEIWLKENDIKFGSFTWRS